MVGLSYVFFKVLAAMKLLRVSPEVELGGLDIPEMGSEGYPKDWEPSPEAIKAAIPGYVVPSGVPAVGDD